LSIFVIILVNISRFITSRRTQSSAAREVRRVLTSRLSESAATFVRPNKNVSKAKKDNKNYNSGK